MDIVRSGMTNYRKWLHNPRYWIIAVLLFIFANNVSSAFMEIALLSDTELSVWIFPFFMYDRYLQFCISLCLIMLFCDAPFMDNLHPYYLQRIGRKKWFFGQLLYIFTSSIIFFCFLWLSMIFICIERINFSVEWGTCLELLAHDNPFWGKFAPDIILNSNPVATSLKTFLICYLVGSLLGVLLMFLNLHIKREAGAIVVGCIAVFDFFLYSYFDQQEELFWLSPISWINPQQYGVDNQWKLVARIIILLVLIFVLACCSFEKLNKINIEISPEI